MNSNIKDPKDSKQSPYSKMKAHCYSDLDTDYHEHFEKYVYDQPFDEVWETYVKIEPAKAWAGKMLHFNQLYSRETGEEVFPGQEYSGGMGAGQVIILNLHIFNGLIKLIVGNEVMEVDKTKKLIRICYLEISKSEGSQFIQFKTLPNGKTEVSHKTLYKSGSWLRDKFIYPYFHTKTINEFHENVRNAILANT